MRDVVEPGDSGSVVFFDRKGCPEWVGLLFAGSFDGWGIVSPIRPVFKALKKLKPKGRVTPIGCSPEAALGDTRAISRRATGMTRTQQVRIERQLRVGRRIVDRRGDQILALDGVVGLGLGLAPAATDGVAVHVLVADLQPETHETIPAFIDGLPTQIVETGRFRAFQEDLQR